MTEDQIRKLERIANYRTAYELAISKGDQKYLVAYSEGKGRRDVFNCVADDARRPAIIAITGTDEITFGKRAIDGATMGEWKICFTGRTQRQAIIEGELPSVITVAKKLSPESGT